MGAGGVFLHVIRPGGKRPSVGMLRITTPDGSVIEIRMEGQTRDPVTREGRSRSVVMISAPPQVQIERMEGLTPLEGDA